MAIISAIAGLISTGINAWSNERQAKSIATRNAISKASTWELAALQSSGLFLRVVSYSLFGLPMVISIVNPESGQVIWQNLEAVPEWYLKTFIAINGAVWGIAELKRPLAAVTAYARSKVLK